MEYWGHNNAKDTLFISHKLMSLSLISLLCPRGQFVAMLCQLIPHHLSEVGLCGESSLACHMRHFKSISEQMAAFHTGRSMPAWLFQQGIRSLVLRCATKGRFPSRQSCSRSAGIHLTIRYPNMSLLPFCPAIRLAGC
jgi:hypothetical protein